MDKESSEFTLRPGRDKSVSLNFNLPLEIDEGSYDVELIAEGRDENQEQFYVENAIRTVGSKPVSLPIRHGDGVTLHVVSKNEREDIRDYSFRDDSD